MAVGKKKKPHSWWLSVRAEGAADLHIRLVGMQVQRRAAGLHPAQAQVLHLLPPPFLLLLPGLQALLGHSLVLHDGGGCRKVRWIIVLVESLLARSEHNVQFSCSKKNCI